MCSFFTKAGSYTGHDVSHSVEWASTAIYSSERNQIWRTGGGNWWDHTYPFVWVCVCVSVHTHAHAHKRLESEEMESDWHHADFETGKLTTQQEGSRTESGNRLNTPLRLRGGCEVTARWKNRGGANCGDDEEDDDNMVELVQLLVVMWMMTTREQTKPKM